MNEPGTNEESQWAAHPFTGTLAKARSCAGKVAGWAAARNNGVQATAEVIDAAAVTLSVPPDRRDVSVTVRPATVWEYAECTCGHWDGPCEHLLVALAGTDLSQPDSHG